LRWFTSLTLECLQTVLARTVHQPHALIPQILENALLPAISFQEDPSILVRRIDWNMVLTTTGLVWDSACPSQVELAAIMEVLTEATGTQPITLPSGNVM
jgi:hypothetical protein